MDFHVSETWFENRTGLYKEHHRPVSYLQCDLELLVAERHGASC
jgi:hypothetical protein